MRLIPASLFAVAAAALMAGCICTSVSPLKEKSSEVSCESPYILVGKGCCLDENDNGVCDADEAEEETTSTMEEPSTLEEETTTSLEETTSTVTSTTEAPATSIARETTTTNPPATIACTVNTDCGERVEKRICYNGDVYVQRNNPLCQRPGTPQSMCIQKLVMDTKPTENCGSLTCKNGECVSS
jgi:hypothetical protein